jgi:AcrR family transcriptional regulator
MLIKESCTFKDLREREHRLRKEIIVDAAERLFEKKPYHEIGMKHIAKEAQVSVASIYTYFKSQEDLLLDILVKDLERVKEITDKLIASGNTNHEDMAHIFVDYLLNNEATFQIICHFMIRGNKKCDILDKFQNIKAMFLEMFNRTLCLAGISNDDKVYSDSFFASLLGVVVTYREYANPEFRKPEDENYIHKITSVTARAFESLHGV